MTLALGDLLLGHSVAQYQVFLSLYCVRKLFATLNPCFLLIPSGPHRNPIKYIKIIPFEAELKAVQGFFLKNDRIELSGYLPNLYQPNLLRDEVEVEKEENYKRQLLLRILDFYDLDLIRPHPEEV